MQETDTVLHLYL